jgi:hypothetical protein
MDLAHFPRICFAVSVSVMGSFMTIGVLYPKWKLPHVGHGFISMPKINLAVFDV